MSDWRWYRRLRGGMWYYLRPTLSDFSHMRYWTRRKPLYNEITLKVEEY